MPPSRRKGKMRGKGGEGDVMVASPPQPPPPPPPNPEKKDHIGPEYTPAEIRRGLAETKQYLDDYVWMISRGTDFLAHSKRQAEMWLRSVLRGETNEEDGTNNPYVTPTLRTLIIPQLPLPTFVDGNYQYNLDIMSNWMTEALFLLDDAEEIFQGSGRNPYPLKRFHNPVFF
jgi:hypothetical protein